VDGEGGLYGRDGVDEGQRLYRIQRGIRGDHARDGAVLVSVCLEEMTSGAHASVTKRGKSNGSGGGRGRGKRAMGYLRSRAGFGPRGILIFFLFFLFFFSKNFCVFLQEGSKLS
jgi:hypothetical protein